MNYSEALDYIHSLGKFRLPATPRRMENVCAVLGNPQEKLKCIHIAGTNGKGSTAVMTADILRTSGLKVGLYISPFIVDFRERIQINNEYISESDLIKYSEAVIKTGVELNEFEFITAAAFLYFKDKNVDVAVLETGLGGRLDATNIIKNPLVSVITKIGLDHTEILGDTVEQIAAEKCGIIKNNNVVTVPNQDKKALSVIKNYAGDLIVPEMPDGISSNLSGTSFVFENKKYFVSLAGEHQAFNAVTAIKAAEKSGFTVTKKNIDNALKNIKFPARLETVSENPLMVIDGAHNGDGAAVLSRFLGQINEDITIVTAMMRDKNCDGFLKEVLPFAKRCIVTEIDNVRCMSAKELSGIANKYTKNVETIPCLEKAIKTAKLSKNAVFIVGSLYLAGEAKKILQMNI